MPGISACDGREVEYHNDRSAMPALDPNRKHGPNVDKLEAFLTNTPRPGDAPGSRERDLIKTLLTERGTTHGNYDHHAGCTQEIKMALRHWAGKSGKDWNGMLNIHRETLDMIAHKLGRIIAGDPDFRDHWADIAGYATLVADRCSK